MAECPQFHGSILIEVLESRVIEAESVHDFLDLEIAKAVWFSIAEFFEVRQDLLVHVKLNNIEININIYK